jgi:hypothetical protein
MSVKFPNVPFATGVPPVFRSLLASAADAVALGSAVENALVADSIQRQGVSPAVWAIYNADGVEALEPDNWISFEPLGESSVADYPMQPGSFQSYNKVQSAIELRLTVTKGGSDTDREDFLLKCERYRVGSDLFDIVVPDYSFLGYALTHWDYSRRSDRGMTLVSVDLSFKEIRQGVKAAFSNSKVPSGADTVNDGPVRAALVSDDLAGSPE